MVRAFSFVGRQQVLLLLCLGTVTVLYFLGKATLENDHD